MSTAGGGRWSDARTSESRARAGAPVLVTGARGFVGARLVAFLAAAGATVRGGVSPRAALTRALAAHEVGYDLAATEADLAPVVAGCSAVVHLAGLAHEAGRGRGDADFEAANVVATERLARAAARAGVRRLVLASSAKVFGERSPPGRAFDERDAPAPQDAYAQSKWRAEQALARVAAESGLETTVLRPPLVIGPGVKANFLQLLDAVARGVPLPLGRVRNARSVLGLDNLVAAVERCLVDPRAAGRTFVVAEPEPVSTPDLVRALAAALVVQPRLVPVPSSWLAVAAGIAGRRGALEKLAGDFALDPRFMYSTLDWQPAVPLEVTLARTASWYRTVRGAPNRAE
jgi:UDP-glucose 4-epimerase